MIRSSSRRVWRLIRCAVQQHDSKAAIEGRGALLQSAREYMTVKAKNKAAMANPASGKSKPTTPRQIVLTPALRRTLQGFIKEDDSEEVNVSRNEHKRRSERALVLGRFLATLLPGQIKNVIRWAGLDERVYDATRLVQKMELSGLRQGKQMQYRVLKGLLRDSQLDVLEYVIECVRCGETVGVQKVLELAAPEKNKREKEMAEKWFQGLVNNDQAVCREVYSFPLEMFDREELRRLTREFKMKLEQREKGKVEELELKQRGKVEESEALEKSRRRALSKSRRMLFRYLVSLAGKTSDGKALVVGGGEAEAPQVLLLEHLNEKRAEALEILKVKQMTRRERRAYKQAKKEEAEEEEEESESDDEEGDGTLDQGITAKGLLSEGSKAESEESDWTSEDFSDRETEPESSDFYSEETEEETGTREGCGSTGATRNNFSEDTEEGSSDSFTENTSDCSLSGFTAEETSDCSGSAFTTEETSDSSASGFTEDTDSDNSFDESRKWRRYQKKRGGDL